MGRRVIDKGFNLPGFRRQTHQVEGEPANQRPPVRRRSRPKPLGLQPGQDEPVQPGAGPLPVPNCGRLLPGHRLEGPKGLFFLGKLGGGLFQVPGKQNVVFVPQVGLDRPAFFLGAGGVVEDHFRQVSPERDPAGGYPAQQGLDRRNTLRLLSVEVIADGAARRPGLAGHGHNPGAFAAGNGPVPPCPATLVSRFKPGHRQGGPGSFRTLGEEGVGTRQPAWPVESQSRLAVHPAVGNPFRRRGLSRRRLHGRNLPMVAAAAGVRPGLEGLVFLELDGVGFQPHLQLGRPFPVAGGPGNHAALPLPILLAHRPRLRPDCAGSNPLLQGSDLTFRQRPGRRHLQISGTAHELDEAALLHLPRHHRRSRLAPLTKEIGRIQTQPPLLQPGTVAHHAVLHQQGADLFLEEIDPGRIRCLTQGGQGRGHQDRKQQKTK